MNSIKIKTDRKYRADEIFYQMGKVVWLPFVIAGLWFAHTGYDRYGELAQCGIQRLSGLPCPGCGGTRAFYYLFKGELLKSLRMNPTVIYGVLAYMHFMLLYFSRKHFGGKRQKEIYIPYYMYIAIGVILIQWVAKIMRIILLIV